MSFGDGNLHEKCEMYRRQLGGMTAAHNRLKSECARLEGENSTLMVRVDELEAARTCRVRIGEGQQVGWWVCEACGTPFDMIGALACRASAKPRFCPGCGRKVVDE